MAQILNGQVAIVTGAGRGFGRAIAMHLAANGASVVLTSRTQTQLDAVVSEIEANGGQALSITADVTAKADVARVVRTAESQFGPVSLLVNNAGVPGPFGPIWAGDPDVWWAAQGVHIRAPLLFLREVLPGMTERRAGRIIIVSAIASRMAAAHLSAYCVGKIAQRRMVEEVGIETQGMGVSAFAIDPGFVFTELALQTLNSPDAQRWLPGMVARLRAKQHDPQGDEDLARCAQRCLDLASGRYDGLSGRYMELTDDLDAMLKATASPCADHKI